MEISNCSGRLQTHKGLFSTTLPPPQKEQVLNERIDKIIRRENLNLLTVTFFFCCQLIFPFRIKIFTRMKTYNTNIQGPLKCCFSRANWLVLFLRAFLQNYFWFHCRTMTILLFPIWQCRRCVDINFNNISWWSKVKTMWPFIRKTVGPSKFRATNPPR